MFSRRKKNKMTPSPNPSNRQTNKHSKKQTKGGVLSKKDATKIINEALTPQNFYAISKNSQKMFEHMIDVLACSTEDFLSGTSSADLDLLQSVGLFQAVGVLFKASHAQGHLAGSAGVIGHGGLADREKRLLAIVQR